MIERLRRFADRPIPLLLRQIPGASRPLAFVAAIVVVLSGLLPNAFVVASGAVVGSIPDAVGEGLDSDPGRRLLTALGAIAVLFVAQQAIGPLREAVMAILHQRVDARVSDRVLRATLGPPGIAILESPETLDDIATAQGVGPGNVGPGMGVRGVLMLAELRLAALGSAALLFAFNWWLAILLVAFRYVSRRLGWKEMAKTMRAQVDVTQGMRQSNYLRDLALRAETAKETRVFGLGGWLVDRFTTAWTDTMVGVWRTRKQGDRRLIVGALLIAVADVVAFAMLGVAAASGDISVGEVTVFAQAIFGIATIGVMRSEDLLIQYGAASLPAAIAVERVAAADRTMLGSAGAAGVEGAAAPLVAAVDRMPEQAVRFESVRFAYPGAAVPVFDGLDLEIPAGRSLAIVGSNGAGKTTLVKLLARLYDPDDGRIAIDGVDLRDLPPRAWQGRIAAIFQDFVRYELSVAENIGFGAVEHLGDRDALERAAERAGASDVVAALPHGWDTVLARQYERGADLSGGQWQRIALARALFAVEGGAGVLVLDEPTANLDVRAEVDLFDRFLELTAGLTTVLISHRFSTVRRADRIVVLEHGRAIEEGTHEELLAREGRYATMFRLQAERFTADADRA